MSKAESISETSTTEIGFDSSAPIFRICVVGLRGIPGVMGGIEKHCEQIYPRIVAHNKRVRVEIAGRSPYLTHQRARHRGVYIRSIWALRHKYLETILHTFLAIIYARFSARTDLVHIHGIGPGLFAPLARLLGMKVVVTHHGADYNRQKWGGFAKWLLRLGERLAISASHSAIVVGNSLCEDLKHRYPASAHKLLHIPNGATLNKIHDAETQTHPVLDQFGLQARRYVLAVGRLVPEKGFQDLVQAFKQSQIPHTLVITGGSDHPDEFSRNLLAQQCEKVVFTGFQSGDALNALYANAALFVLPSYHEGLPIAALEALSFGRPVLLSDIEPNLDVSLPSDCYFPVGDCDALARKLAVGDYRCYRVSTQAILARYDWDDIAQRTLRQFSKVLPELA